MKLKATKTSLYKLIKKYAWNNAGITPPKMKDTHFTKLARRRSYWLKWYAYEMFWTASFFVCAGTAMLIIETDTGQRTVYRPTLQDLRELGMIDYGKAAQERMF